MLTLKLSLEEREELAELLEGEGWQMLLTRILPQLLEVRTNKVLNSPVNSQEELLQLALTKAHADGAKSIIKDLLELKAAQTSAAQKSALSASNGVRPKASRR